MSSLSSRKKTRKSSSAAATTLSSMKKSLEKKQKQCEQLFDKIKTMQEQMETLQSEIMQLDANIFEVQQEQEGIGGALSSAQAIMEADGLTISEPIPMTMHPDEILTEPTQAAPPQTQLLDDEILTDPHTQLPQQQQHEQQRSAAEIISNTRDMDEEEAAINDFYDDDEHHDFPEEEYIMEAQRPPSAADDSIPSTSAVVVAQEQAAIPHQPYYEAPALSVLNVDTKPTNNNKKEFQALVSPQSPFSERDIISTLNKTFRIQSFRDTQLSVIQATLSGQDVFVLMRTGGGKSLTYQLPCVLELRKSQKITLVISPLLSLIHDQQEQMNEFCPNSCVSFTSSISTSIQSQQWQRVRDPNGGVGMILVTPERVSKSNKLKSELQRLHDQHRLGRFVIDECHCACQWGHDFRPDYAKLGVLKHFFPTVPCSPVTATASERVRQDCAQILNLQTHYRFFRSTANRPNLHYKVRWKDQNVVDDMCAFIREHHFREAGIIYTFSKKDANTVAKQLCDRGIIAEAYHSDVSATKKSHIHTSWMRNKTQVVVATIAFGLGINKPDVRFVLHHSLSKTLEAYYQESGRAGRDGLAANCILYYAPKDVPRMIKMISGESNAEQLFQSMVRYATEFGTDQVCRLVLLTSLGETVPDFKQKLEQASKQQAEQENGSYDKDVTAHAITCLQLLHECQHDNVTMAMLIKHWRTSPKNALECVKNNPPGKDFSVSDCEHLIVVLHLSELIQIDVKYTAYDSVVYWKCTRLAETFLLSENPKMSMRVPHRKTATATTSLTTRTTTTPTSTGWLDTKNKKKTTAAKKKKANKTTTAKKKTTKSKKRVATKKKAPKAAAAAKQKPSTTTHKNIRNFLAPSSSSVAAAEVIELDDDSSSSSEEEVEKLADLRRRRKSSSSAPIIRQEFDYLMESSDSENEFMG